MNERIPMTLTTLANNIEKAVPESRCQVLEAQGQIIVRFTNRPDVELTLLTSWEQRQLQDGFIDADLYSELLFSLRRIAN
ncbi:MAG: hypothetical protein IKQ45_00740 [Clostridia bacterium]|nr:hypothetical protein [Clostridia bacterium]